MRIAHVSESIDPLSGGTSTAQEELLVALARVPELELTAYAPAVDHPERLDPLVRERFRWTGPTGRLRPGSLAGAVLRDLSSFDLVHIHGLWNPDVLRVSRAARRAGIATVWQPHGMLVSRAMSSKRFKKSLFMAAGLRRELINAAAIICSTEGERKTNACGSVWAGGRTEVVPLPVTCPIDRKDLLAYRAKARSEFGVRPGTSTVVFLGRLHPVKRLELSLEAFRLAREMVPELQFLIIGAGEPKYERRLRALADDLGITEAVDWAGWIEKDRRWSLLGVSDALTINSRFENFGYVIPEAIMAGAVVVATENLAMAEDLCESGVGVVVPAEADALAHAYVDAIRRPAGQREQARQWADERFAPPMVAARLLALYRSILSDT